MAKQNDFVSHIAEGLSRFGIGIDSEVSIGSDIHKLMLTDTVNNRSYIALARRKEASKPEKFWNEVIRGKLKNILTEAASRDDIPPAALIVPSIEANAVIAESAKLGAKPTVFQLFDGFVMVGYKRSDTTAMLDYEKPRPEIAAEQPPAAHQRMEQPKNPQEKVPPAESLTQMGDALRSEGLSPRKLAAAALLGVTLASVPFAVNKLWNMSDEEASPQAYFIQNNILNESIHGSSGERNTLEELAKNAPLDRDNYKELIHEGYLYELAQNPHLPADVLSYFVDSPDSLLRAAAAENKSLTEDALHKLAYDKDPSVRANAARHPAMPGNLLERLGADPDYRVRSYVLDNPNITESLLQKIEPVTAGGSCENREKIYGGPCMTASALAYHINNPDPCIRRGIARNKNTSESVLKKLTEDRDPVVRRNALSNPSLENIDMEYFFPEGWLLDSSAEKSAARRSLLENPNIPAEILRAAAMYNPKVYGSAVAKNPSAPADVTEGLYYYAMPRGGIDGFMNEINRMPQDEKLLEELTRIKNGPQLSKSWTDVLRDRVAKSFSKNVYDPTKVVNFMRAGKNKTVLNTEKEHPLFAAEKLKERLTLADLGTGGEFFEDDGDDILTDPGKQAPEEFFSDLTEDIAPQEKAIRHTAGQIVDHTMKELTPIMEKALHDRQRDGSTSFVSPTGETSSPSLGAAERGEILSSAKDSLPTGLLSDKLYQNSCKEIHNLIKIF